MTHTLLLQLKHNGYCILHRHCFTILLTGNPLRHRHDHADSFFVQIRVYTSQYIHITYTSVGTHHKLASYTALCSVFLSDSRILHVLADELHHLCLTTGELADLFCTAWGNGAAWENLCQGGPHEANFLKLDCSRIRNRLGWKPRWQVDEAVVNTAKWYQAWLAGQNMAEYTDCQIKEYFGI